MMKDYEREPEFREWADQVRSGLIPKLRDSAVAVSVLDAPPDTDIGIKFAVELGMMVMLDKPIVVIVGPGTKIPPKLARIADRIIEGSPVDDPKGVAERLRAACDELLT